MLAGRCLAERRPGPGQTKGLQCRQVSDSLQLALSYFPSITINLIYGTSGLTNKI